MYAHVAGFNSLAAYLDRLLRMPGIVRGGFWEVLISPFSLRANPWATFKVASAHIWLSYRSSRLSWPASMKRSPRRLSIQKSEELPLFAGAAVKAASLLENSPGMYPGL